MQTKWAYTDSNTVIYSIIRHTMERECVFVYTVRVHACVCACVYMCVCVCVCVHAHACNTMVYCMTRHTMEDVYNYMLCVCMCVCKDERGCVRNKFELLFIICYFCTHCEHVWDFSILYMDTYTVCNIFYRCPRQYLDNRFLSQIKLYRKETFLGVLYILCLLPHSLSEFLFQMHAHTHTHTCVHAYTRERQRHRERRETERFSHHHCCVNFG